MMKKLLILFLLSVYVISVKAQTGINSQNPTISSVLEISGTNKGVLFPRLNIPNLSVKAPITAIVMPDGLLAYNKGTLNSQTLYYWDVLANANAGAWMQQLYFKETPKVATLGLINNRTLLDNKIAGDEEPLSLTTNNYTIVSSGYMPGLKLNGTNSGRFVIGPGTYTLEISYLLNAPPALPATNATVISGGYYNMGYFSDLFITPYNPNTGTFGTFIFGGRVEGAVLSKVSTDHRIRFLHTFQLAGVGQTFEIDLYLGRRQGSSFFDKVDVLSNGTFIKITKLN